MLYFCISKINVQISKFYRTSRWANLNMKKSCSFILSIFGYLLENTFGQDLLKVFIKWRVGRCGWPHPRGSAVARIILEKHASEKSVKCTQLSPLLQKMHENGLFLSCLWAIYPTPIEVLWGIFCLCRRYWQVVGMQWNGAIFSAYCLADGPINAVFVSVI